ncbi:MAG: toxin-antitoxin system YwqK family antitoxin [Planctomycetota bacterium]
MRELPLVTVLALAGLVLVLGLRDGASTRVLAANDDTASAGATTTVALAEPASGHDGAAVSASDTLAPVEATGERALADGRGPSDFDLTPGGDEPRPRRDGLGVAPQPRVDTAPGPQPGRAGVVGLREEGRFHRGVRHGEWITLHDDGSLHERGQYVDGLRDGTWETFSPAGSLLMEAEYVEGQMDGDWRIYADAGDMIGEGQYDENVRSGRWTLWYSNGSVKERGRYVGGLREGVWEFFDDLGRPTVRTGTYRAGIRID